MSELTVELLDVALQAAKAGAEVLRAGALRGFDVKAKGPGDLVTDVDVAAERAVRALIEARRPDDEITGEELPATGRAQTARIRWSIDPLDGTTNFTRRIPYYATCVGAVDADGSWVAGAVIAPALDKTYFAQRGGGAWLAESGAVRRLTGPSDAPGARLLGLGLSYSEAVRRQQYAELAEQMLDYTDARLFGSAALAACAVAEGAIDGYVETDLAEYDWAAAALIAEEAGLAVTRPSADSTALRIERR